MRSSEYSRGGSNVLIRKLQGFILLVSLSLSSVLWAYQVADVQNGGTITGTVKAGKGISITKVKVNADEEYCEGKIVLDNVKMGPGGTIRSVIVYLTDINQGKGVEPQAAVLTHKQCLFSPHVQVVPVGSTLALKNTDPVAHNFHAFSYQAFSQRDPLFSVSLPLKGQKAERTLSTPGLIQIECDKHRWEQSWILVSEHPYAVITDEKGEFTMKDVPAGTYKIKAWHEGWKQIGERDIDRVEFEPMEEMQTVTVQPGQPVEVVFSNLKSANPVAR